MKFMKKIDKNFVKKEFLISELQRFYKEEECIPTQLSIQSKNDYPHFSNYRNYFGSWNEALQIAGLEINKMGRLDGTETCSYCGKYANEIYNFTQWLYHDDIRYCRKHGNGEKGKLPDYVVGILDINSSPGRGRAGEIIVVKTLKIGTEHDCALISMGYSFDMYNDEYGKIDVKTSILSDKYNSWTFLFGAKKIADTYICIGMSLDTKNIEHVWIVSNIDDIRDLTGFTVINTKYSLFTHEEWEVNSKIYDDAWQEMLENYTDGKCKIFGKKGD